MSSRGTKFGRKLCLAGFYHCWDYCLPRSLPVPLVGLVGWWGSSDLGVLVMAFFTLSVVFCHPRTRATWWDSGTLASPGARCCAVLGRPSAQLGKEVCAAAPSSFMTPPRCGWQTSSTSRPGAFHHPVPGATLLFTRRLQNCGDRSVYTTDSTRAAGGCWPQQLKIRQNFSKLDFGFIFSNFIYWLYSYF